jgi:hypothetical protein
MAVGLLGGLGACVEKDPEFVSLSEEGLVLLEPGSGQKSVEVRSNAPWVATSDAEWAKITNGNGSHKGAFNIVYDKHHGTDARSANITITTREVTQTLTLQQTGVEGEISVSNDSVVFYKEGGNYTVAVVSNTTWTLSSSSEWCELSSESGTGVGTFSLTAGENLTGHERTATVSLSAVVNGQTILRTIEVSQKSTPSTITVTPAELAINKLAQSANITVVTEVAWDTSIDCDWMTVAEGGSGEGDGQIELSIEANNTDQERTGMLTVFTSDLKLEREVHTVTVMQSPTIDKFDLFFTDVALSPMGETRLIPIDTDVEIVGVRSSTENNDPHWCAAELVNGDVQIESVYNDSGVNREAYVTVTVALTNGETLDKVFRVSQEYLDFPFEFPASEYLFRYEGETKQILLTAFGDWRLMLNDEDIPDWLEIAPKEGNGTMSVSFTAEKNSFIKERTIDLVFATDTAGKTAVITLRQEKNPSSAIDDYMHLGKGYDANGEYAVDNYVRAAVLDWNKLDANGYIADMISPNSTEERTIHSKTASQYQENISGYAGISGGIGGFNASVRTSFSSSALTSKENEFASFRHITKKQSVKLHANLGAAVLREAMTAEAEAEINGATNATEFEALIMKYGTHVITGFILGGSLDYSMSADISSVKTQVSWSAAVKAGYEFLSASATAEAGYEEYKAMSESSANFEERLIARGGSSQYASGKGDQAAFGSWLASLDDPTKWVMVDYDGSKLIPIWEFMSNGHETQFETYVKEYIKSGLIPEAVSTHKRLKIQQTHVANTTDDGDNWAEMRWTTEYWVDDTQLRGTYHTLSVPDENWTGSNIESWDLSAEHDLSELVAHKLYIVFRGFEGDTTFDDDFWVSATIMYDPVMKVWRHNGNNVASGSTISLLDNDSRAVYKLTWTDIPPEPEQ